MKQLHFLSRKHIKNRQNLEFAYLIEKKEGFSNLRRNFIVNKIKMGKPHHHAESSAKKFGGKMQDYLEIHVLLDSSKMAFADNRHRALTHNSWFINHILPKIFGDIITNSDGKRISVIDIAELHILEDFNHHFIPTAQDYLSLMTKTSWLNGQGLPQSVYTKEEKPNTTIYKFKDELCGTNT